MKLRCYRLTNLSVKNSKYYLFRHIQKKGNTLIYELNRDITHREIVLSLTNGINHLGLTVNNLFETKTFFIDVLGWTESGYDPSYPRTAVSDGKIRLTLWQVDTSLSVEEFNRRKNIGLHHLALEVESEEKLNALYDILKHQVEIEFPPELVGSGPRKHMMCYEPGGIRLEFIWPGT